jgi:long-chain-fatty-acid--CoA ligase ACSBG
MASTIKGPDRVLDAENYTSTDVGTPVKLRIGETGPDAYKPISIISMLEEQAVGDAAELTAMAVKRPGDDKWTKWTYREYLEDVKTVAKAFIKLGLESRGGVTILGFNSPEWCITDVATIFADGIATGIYQTNNASACKYIAADCKANIAVVEDENQLEKFLQIRDELPHLKIIVQYSGVPTVEGVLSWTDLLNIGKKESDDELENRKAETAINMCCKLVYTSGTTGMPKGVMLSHDSITFLTKMVVEMYDLHRERSVSFLPLSHIAANHCDLYLMIRSQSTVYFADKNALRGSLIHTLKEVRPTLLLAVPRVWEKFYEKMVEVGRSTEGLKRMIGTWAKSTGLERNMKVINGEVNPDESGWGYWIANWLVFSQVKANLGLDQCKHFFSAAAPISVSILEYFLSLDISIFEIYGMSEVQAHIGNNTKSRRLGTIGKTWTGLYAKTDNDTGEICMKGRNVMMGYLNNPHKTLETFKPGGWLKSGDIGTVDTDGYFSITGRIKDILITAGGENVAPIIVENAIKKELPCISNVMVVGDRRKFLSCVITFLVNINPDTNVPTTDLAPNAINWAQEEVGFKALTVSDLVSNPKTMKVLEAGIERANTHAISNAQRIRKFIVLETDFSLPGGELGPTFKVKRHEVEKKYRDRIDAIYNETEPTSSRSA